MHRYRIVVSFLLLVIGVYACATANGAQRRARPRAKVITLERGQCFGTCPVYKLTIYSDGTVRYQGIRYVKNLGSASARISRARLRELVLEFQNIYYFNLPDSFTPGNKQCSEYVTDMPSATTSLMWQGRSKTIHHYHGCRGTSALDNLTELENKIDKAVGVTKWTKKS